MCDALDGERATLARASVQDQVFLELLPEDSTMPWLCTMAKILHEVRWMSLRSGVASMQPTPPLCPRLLLTGPPSPMKAWASRYASC